MGRLHRRVVGGRTLDSVLLGIASALFAAGLVVSLLMTVMGAM